jgi:hypothetical protein
MDSDGRPVGRCRAEPTGGRAGYCLSAGQRGAARRWLAGRTLASVPGERERERERERGREREREKGREMDGEEGMRWPAGGKERGRGRERGGEALARWLLSRMLHMPRLYPTVSACMRV